MGYRLDRLRNAGLNGAEVARRVRRIDPSVAIIVMTGYANSALTLLRPRGPRRRRSDGHSGFPEDDIC
jgi:CheY-like chemotaxis protein